MSVALPALARYVRAGARRREGAEERCELCAEAIGPEHGHLVDLEDRGLRCACRACSILFDQEGAARYRRVPDRVLAEPGFALDEQAWAELGVPVRLAFFFHNSALARWVAVYPSPAGPTEAEVPLATWQQRMAGSLLAARAAPDVEALLVRGRPGGGARWYLAPIDACYRLVGEVRRTWRGFDGGDDARRAIDTFFTEIQRRARIVGPPQERTES